jgi:hypothetical protein
MKNSLKHLGAVQSSISIAASRGGKIVRPRQLVPSQRGIFPQMQSQGVNGDDGDGGSSSGGSTIIQGPGPVLKNVCIKPIFWGAAWYQPTTPSVEDILWAIQSILYGPFMSGLAQYGVGNGWLDPNPIYTGMVSEPPNPFLIFDIEALIASLVYNTLPGSAGFITNPASIAKLPAILDSQLLCVVFTPPGVDAALGNVEANGYHTAWHDDTFVVPFAWIKNINSLDFISTVFSHELAEACTNPLGNGFVGATGSCGQNGQCEIGDYCYGSDQGGRGSGVLGGVEVQAYWSIQDGGCHLPEERHVPSQAVGNLALIQGRFLSRGNFELLAPRTPGGFSHYSRDNDDARLWWYGPETYGVDLGAIEAITMIQSNFTAGSGIGNLEVVAHWKGELLFFWREDVSPYIWHGPTVVPLVPPGYNAITVSGVPSMIQSRFGYKGNFELVTPLPSGGLAHYSRANDDPNLGWYGPAIFAVSEGIFDSASLIQSHFSSSGNGPGNLEVVARTGGVLLHYSRDDAPPYQWHGPNVIPLNGQITTGTPSFIQDSFGTNGYFQVVTPIAAGGLAHYTRDNGPFGGLKWYGPTIFGDDYGGPYEAISLIQSNFSSSPNGIGNLELIARSRNNTLFHFWRVDNTQIAGNLEKRMWYGPWVVSY